MALVSYGYPESVGADPEVWARFATNAFGRRYAALSDADFKATIAGVGTRRLNIAAGWLGGKGVLVNNTAPTTYEFPAPAGTSQWMALVLRRWTGVEHDTSVLSHVLGTSSRAVPTLVQDPGESDDQPLFLCRISSSSTNVQEIVDLRPISFEAGGFYLAHSPEAMDLLEDMAGVEVYRTDTKTFYKRIMSPTGTLSWKNLSMSDEVLTGFAAINAVDESGFGRSSACRMVRTGESRWAHFEVTRGGGDDGGSFSSNSNGGMSDRVIGQVNTADRPGSGIVVPLVGRLEHGGATHAVFGHMTSAGGVYINSMLPGLTVDPGDTIILEGQYVAGV